VTGGWDLAAGASLSGDSPEDRHAWQAALILFWSLRDPGPRAAFRGW
jgi:hypothetical protein